MFSTIFCCFELKSRVYSWLHRKLGVSSYESIRLRKNHLENNSHFWSEWGVGYIERTFWSAQNVEVRFQCREFYLSIQQLFTKQHGPGTFLALGMNKTEKHFFCLDAYIWENTLNRKGSVELRSKQGWRTEQGLMFEIFHFEPHDLKPWMQMTMPLHTGLHSQELTMRFFNKAQPLKSSDCFFSVTRESVVFPCKGALFVKWNKKHVAPSALPYYIISF